MEDVVAFIDARQQDVAEVKRPDAIISFLKTDDLLLERKYSRFPTPSGDGSPCGPGALALGTTSGQEVRSG